MTPKTIEFKVDNEIIPIEIKQYLSYEDIVNFVENGIKILFDDAEESYVYLPYMYDFSFGFMLLNYMTNFKTTGDSEDLWDLIVGTNLVETIMAQIPVKVIDMLVHSFDEAIEFKKNVVYSYERKALTEMKAQIQEYIDILQLFTDRIPAGFGEGALEKLVAIGNIEDKDVALRVLKQQAEKDVSSVKR